MLFFYFLSTVIFCCEALSIGGHKKTDNNEATEAEAEESFLEKFGASLQKSLEEDWPEEFYSYPFGRPEQDSFYYPDLDSYAGTAPGTPLSYRKLSPPSMLTGVKEIVTISYSTKYANGSTQAAVTTLIIPKRPKAGALISYQVAEDSSYIECSPSYELLAEGSSDSVLQSMIDQGYYINMPDYEGPASSFGVGKQAGQATLDSIRAVYNSASETGFDPDLKTVMYGYSGGSFATLWAAEMQPYYANELNIVGAAVGGVVANLTSILQTIEGTFAAGFIPSAMAGISSQYPEFKHILYQDMTAEGLAAFAHATSHCLWSNLLSYIGVLLIEMFNSKDQIMYNPVVQKVLAENSLGASTPKIPLYVHHAMEDGISPVETVNDLVADYCEAGANIEYLVNSVGGHVGEAQAGEPFVFDYLSSRVASHPLPSGCRSATREVTAGSQPTKAPQHAKRSPPQHIVNAKFPTPAATTAVNY